MNEQNGPSGQEPKQNHPMAEDLLQRLAFKSSGGFLRATWPRNALIVLAGEIISLRQQVAGLRAELKDRNLEESSGK